MKNKGFTLVELLGTVILLSLIAVVVYPNVVEQIEKKQNEIDEAKLELVYSGAKDYILSNSNSYPNTIGAKYCIPLDLLNQNKYISIDVDDIKKRGVQVTIGKDNNYSFQMLDNCD